MRKILCLLFLFGNTLLGKAQRLPDHVYMKDIHTVKLFQQGNQQSLPLISLGSDEKLELHFDDLGGYPRNYYYSFVLCNADWTPADINVFDYIRGFTQNRLSQYRMSSVSETKYVHYQALLPENSCMPVKSGNYLLKVFLDADTSKLAFTKRFMVVDNRVIIGAQVQQPFDNSILRTHQKIQLTVNTQQLNLLSPQQTKLVILQNNKWDDAVTGVQPTFIKGKVLEYNSEDNFVFPAGKEYRWADLRSFRFHSDRVDHVERGERGLDIYIKPDLERNDLRYIFFQDRDGWDEISTTESVNPWWQTDYARVHFSFVPAAHQSFAGRSVYLIGESTGNQISDSSKMQYDAAKGIYTKTLLLKQGYYSYAYVTKSDRNPDEKSDPALTEGNYWETENTYTILFYYRSFSSRYDELIGISTINSLNGRSGF